jgi:hypothetical protein
LYGYYEFNRDLNPRGFIASIVEETSGVYSLQKYVANEHAAAFSSKWWGPSFDAQLDIHDRCNLIDRPFSFSSLAPFAGHRGGYTREGFTEPMMPLFGTWNFRVSEFEVFQVELVDTV